METVSKAFDERRLGTWIETTAFGEVVKAHVPPLLPPLPPIVMDAFQNKLAKAQHVLGQLDGITSILPSPPLFIFMYVRKEALLSSQIEGTQSSLSDLLLFEADSTPLVPLDDVEEVSNYIAALNHGMRRLEEGIPLSLRLLREIHGVLLQGGRGATKDPGEFRRSQNWIGGHRPSKARYVPPPPQLLMQCLDNLERYLHDDTQPPVVKAAVAHVQFESIHPFLDGNGRLGRLLIALMFCVDGLLEQPTLYLSLFLKKHRDTYYDLLQRVRLEGAWEDWLEFFLDGLIETASEAVATAKSLMALVEKDQAVVKTLGRASPSALVVFHYLQEHALMSIPKAAEDLNVSEPTIQKSIRHLMKLGIVQEITGKKRRRVYAYQAYLDLLMSDTQPLGT